MAHFLVDAHLGEAAVIIAELDGAGKDREKGKYASDENQVLNVVNCLRQYRMLLIFLTKLTN